MESVRTLEGNAESNGDLNKQMRHSILSWNAGTKRGEVTASMKGSFNVIIIQEAETHCNEIRKSTEQQFYIYQVADQLVLCCKSTFEPEGLKIQKEIQGTANQDSFGLKSRKARELPAQQRQDADKRKQIKRHTSPSTYTSAKHKQLREAFAVTPPRVRGSNAEQESDARKGKRNSFSSLCYACRLVCLRISELHASLNRA